MQKELIELCIGAILHDIGKIGERARIKLSGQSEGMKPYICPTEKDGNYGYLHAACTNEFMEKIKNKLPRELDASKIANIACYHHKPDQNNPLHYLVQTADWLSAGQDRNEGQKDDSSVLRDAGIRDFANSIFAGITPIVKKDWKKSESVHLPLIPLELNEKVFPCSAAANPVEEHNQLWNSILKHFDEQLEPTSPALFINQLIWVFGLYSWSVRSHRSQVAEISLLDHSLTTAAFACALYQYHSQTNTMTEKDIQNYNPKKFRIVQGDLSGIQSYLYDAALDSPSGLSKRLRAKSFYLSLITRLAGSLLLQRVGLPEVNRIIDAGGNFTLLVHNTPDCLNALKETQKQIDDWFRRTFAGKLHLNLCYETKLSGEDFRKERFYEIQQKLAWQMDHAKRLAQRAVLADGACWNPSAFLPPIDPSLIPKTPSEEGENSEKLPENQFFKDLGEKLTRGNFLIVSTAAVPGGFSEDLARLPLAHPFDAYYFAVKGAPAASPDITGCFELVPGNESKSLGQTRCGLLLANYIPRQTEQDRPVYEFPQIADWLRQQLEDKQEAVFTAGKPKSFAQLCADSFRICKTGEKIEIKGEPLLAVLKADVDRLGMLFSKTLENARAPLSWYISLSRQLNLFFCGILPGWFLNPPKENPDFRNIYTVYAGGDDLLLVGPWTTMLQFAAFLRRKFKEYVCGHPEVSISAGIALCHSRFPLSQAAKQADDALDKAKKTRDRICVFNTVLTWEAFEQAIGRDASFFDEVLTEEAKKHEIKVISKGFIYRLLRYAKTAEECVDAGKTPVNLRKLLWRSHLKYDIDRSVRPVDNNKKQPIGRSRIEELTALTADDAGKDKIRRLKVAATYCLYLNR